MEEPVSYTHLDVDKRQGVAVQVIPLDRLEGEVGPVAEHVDGRVYVVDLADAERRDVYKRQAYVMASNPASNPASRTKRRRLASVSPRMSRRTGCAPSSIAAADRVPLCNPRRMD